MDVYLLPVTPAVQGRDARFELYCEPAASPAEAAGEGDQPSSSIFRRWVKGFNQALADGEEEERRQEDGAPPADGGSQVSRFLKRKLAAAVAEQRLLWHLRHATAADLHHPATLPADQAVAMTAAECRRDFDKHRLWCVVDGVIVVASTPLALVPGPNFLAYYFMFRSVGHFFALRGARKGMDPALWTPKPSEPLADLERALALEPAGRDARIAAVETALGLSRLARFMRRVARRTTPA